MVKNSGRKNRARQHAAANDTTYQQARETLDAQHTRDALAALVAECGSTPLPPGQAPTRMPLGLNVDGAMQWSEAEDEELAPVVSVYDGLPRLTEIIGGPGAGKTTMVNRIIAHLATEDPRHQSILLFAGDREVESARKRWADWPQVEVVGRNPSSPHGRDRVWAAKRSDGRAVLFPTPDGIPADQVRAHRDNLMGAPIMRGERGGQVLVFDDWFTESDGSLLRFTQASLDDPERLSPAGWADWRMAQVELCNRVEWRMGMVGPRARAASPVIAAFRPGHTSQRDESGDIMRTIRQGRGFNGVFTPHDAFTQTPYGLERADKIVVLDDGGPHAWLLGVDARRFPTQARDEALERQGSATSVGGAGADPMEVDEFVHGMGMREEINLDLFDFDRGFIRPYMEADPLGVVKVSDDEVAVAMEGYLADYWSIGERGPVE